MARRVILVRHGESALNASSKQREVFCGQLDTPLTDRGREQARQVGIRLAAADFHVTQAVSSALKRACETLELIVRQFPTPPRCLPPAAAFNERSLGQFEGLAEEEVFRRWPEYRRDPLLRRFRTDFIQKAPGGENFTEVTERAWAALDELLGQSSEDVLLVSHCNTMRCLLGRALDLPHERTVHLKIPHATPIVLVPGVPFRVEGESPPE